MRQFLFTGFNAFGQHAYKCSNVDRTPGFNEIIVPHVTSQEAHEKLIIELSWRYTAYALGNKLYLQGLLDESPGEQLKVEAAAAIKALATADTHCLVLLDNGELYKLETKCNATLQPVRLEAASSVLKHAQKRGILGDSKTPACRLIISHIACGTHINVAISASNAVFSIPSCLHQFPQRQWRVQQLVCGNEHALLLNGNGDVYAWGNGLRGQLGQATVGCAETPTLLEALAGLKITHIAAGGWHSAAISAFGDIYTWGLNCDGQLGMRVMRSDSVYVEPTVYPLPQLHDLPDCCAADAACQPQRVFAGCRHTVLQRSCGRLWVSGWSAYGQLGIAQQPEQTRTDTFLALPDSCRYLCCDIRCGPWSTLLMISK